MKISHKDVGAVTVVAIEGRFDGVTSNQIEEEIFNLFRQGKKSIVIDFRQVEFLSSAGMRVLLKIAKQSNAISSQFYLVHLSPAITEVLKMTGFYNFLQIHEDTNSIPGMA